MNRYIIACLIVILLLSIVILIDMKPKTEFAKMKVKTESEMSGFLKQFLNQTKESLPERGLFFFTNSNNHPRGWIIIDIDNKTMKYSLDSVYWESGIKEGTIRLTDTKFNKIIDLANKIWASESDFETEYGRAAVTITELVLIDKKEYRNLYTTTGSFGGEADQMHKYLVSLVPEQANQTEPNTVKYKIEQFLKTQNIEATFKTESDMLVVEHNIVSRLVQRKTGKNQDSKTVVEEDMVPAEDGFRIFVWVAQYVGQAVRPQELKTHGPDGKLVYTDYLGTTDQSADEGRERVDYTIGYGTKVKKEFVDEIKKIINTSIMVRERKLIPRNFPFFKKAKIFIEGIPSFNTGDTQRAIDAETGLEYWKYIAVKDGEEIEMGKLYSVKEDGTTETHAEKFNALIKEEKLNLDKNQAKEFAEMVLNISFGSVYSGGKIQKVVEEKGIFKATARLKQTIGMVPYHDETDLMFSFNKDGTLIQFQRGEWMEVKGH